MSEEGNASNGVEAVPGQVVYDNQGNALGRIQGFTEHGFTVSVHEHVSLEHEPGQGFGEGYLMWRCAQCGEMGELEKGIPESCPNCGAPEEDLYAWVED